MKKNIFLIVFLFCSTFCHSKELINTPLKPADIPKLTPESISQIEYPLALTFIGDSLTYHDIYTRTAHKLLLKKGLVTNKYSLYAYPSKPAKYIIDLINSGKLQLTPVANLTNIAFIMIGTNGYCPKDLLELVSLIKSRGYVVVILTTPPRRGPNINSGAGGPGSNRAYNNWIRSHIPALSKKNLLEVQYIDIEQPLLDTKIPLTRGGWLAEKYNSDNVHLNEAGYELVGRTIAENIINCDWANPGTAENASYAPASSAVNVPLVIENDLHIKGHQFPESIKVFGYVVSNNADRVVSINNGIRIEKKGTANSTVNIRFSTDKKLLPPGLYELSTAITLGGVYKQILDVKIGSSFGRLHKRVSLSASNKKSWQKFILVSPESFAIYPGETNIEITVSGKAAKHKVVKNFKLKLKKLFPGKLTTKYGELRANAESLQASKPENRIYILETEDIMQSEKLFHFFSDATMSALREDSLVRIINKDKAISVANKLNITLPAMVIMDKDYMVQNALFVSPDRHLILLDFMPDIISPLETDLNNFINMFTGSQCIVRKYTKAKPKVSAKILDTFTLKKGISPFWLSVSGWAGKAGLSLWGLGYEAVIQPSPGDRCPVTAFDRIDLNKTWNITPVQISDGTVVLERSLPNCTWGKATAYACLYLKSESSTNVLLRIQHSGYFVTGWLDDIKLDFNEDSKSIPENSKDVTGKSKKVIGVTDQGGNLVVDIKQNYIPMKTTLHLSNGWNRLLLKFVTQQEQGEDFIFKANFTDIDGNSLSNLLCSTINKNGDRYLHKDATQLEPLIRTEQPLNLLQPTDKLSLSFDLRKRSWRLLKKNDPVMPVIPFKARLVMKITDYDGKDIAMRKMIATFPGNVIVNFDKKLDCGYYAVHSSLYTTNGQFIIAYPPDGFSVIRGTVSQELRKSTKKVATTYYYLADGRENKIYFPWMRKMGIYMNIGSSPGFPIELAESAKKANITLVADFYDKYSRANFADKKKLTKQAAPYTRYYKSYNEIDHHKELRMTPEKWVAREKNEYNAVKEARKDGFYVGGSLVYPGSEEWFIDCLKLGIDKYHDAWDVHAYPDSAPVLGSGFGNSPRELIRGINSAYNQVGRTNSLPFWIGETGARASHGLDARKWQAEMIPKLIASAMSMDNVFKIGFLRPWYYGRSFDGIHNDISVAHMPGDAATYTAVALIDGFPYKKLDYGDSIQAAEFGDTIMLWTTYKKTEVIKVQVKKQKKKYLLVDVVGRTRRVYPDENGMLKVLVSPSPIYIIPEMLYYKLTQ